MKENKYDDKHFFEQYSQMPRSKEGLQAAGEWHEFKKLLPDFHQKVVLDLGCGFGWHCIYAAEQGAKKVVGVDLSARMLTEAKHKTTSPIVHYERRAMEDIDIEPETYDIVLSSLALHYVASFNDICQKVNTNLITGGSFVFSVEHPIFTADGRQDWFTDEAGNKLHCPLIVISMNQYAQAISLVKMYKNITAHSPPIYKRFSKMASKLTVSSNLNRLPN